MKPLLTWVLVLVAFAAAAKKAKSPVAAHPPAMKTRLWSGKYSNPEYFYSLSLPAGVNGLSTPAHLNHGICVNPAAPRAGECDPDRSIAITGTHDSTNAHSVERLTDEELSAARQRIASASVTFRKKLKLAGIEANRYRLTGQGQVEETVIALRPRPGHQWLIYSITLSTTPAHLDEDLTLLDKLLAGFKTEPFPVGEEVDPFKLSEQH